MKDIKGYNGLFKATEQGEVFRVTADGLKKVNVIDTGTTLQVNLFSNGVSKRITLSRLIYSTFKEEVKRNEYVGFKDNNYKNVSLDNLILSEKKKTISRSSANLDPGDNKYLFKFLKANKLTEINKNKLLNSIKSQEPQSKYIEDNLRKFYEFKEKKIKEGEELVKELQKNSRVICALYNAIYYPKDMTILIGENLKKDIKQLKELTKKL